jgi:site-specific DNA-methyltransferase (adenine-specific)
MTTSRTSHLVSKNWSRRNEPALPCDAGGPLQGRFCGPLLGVPTMKPLALMERLVKLVTPRGGVTLDPYCGSGTTLRRSPACRS